MRLLPASVCALALSAYGCGKDTDDGDDGAGADAVAGEAAAPFYGVYEAKERLRSKTGCDETEMAPAEAWEFRDAYFKLGAGEFFGHALPLTYYACTSGTACSDAIMLNWTFDDYEAGVWKGANGASVSPSSKPATCWLNVQDGTARMNGGFLELREEVHGGEVPLPEGMRSCTGEQDGLDKLIAANRATLPCTRVVLVKAAKL